MEDQMPPAQFELKVEKDNEIVTFEAWRGEDLITRRQVPLRNSSDALKAFWEFTGAVQDFQSEVNKWIRSVP